MYTVYILHYFALVKFILAYNVIVILTNGDRVVGSCSRSAVIQVCFIVSAARAAAEAC